MSSATSALPASELQQFLFPGAVERVGELAESWIKEKKRVLIYAAGKHTQALLALSKICECNIIGIADSNQDLWGSHLGGIGILSPAVIPRLKPDIVLISSMVNQEEIRTALGYLTEYGITLVTLYSSKQTIQLANIVREYGVNAIYCRTDRSKKEFVWLVRPVLKNLQDVQWMTRPKRIYHFAKHRWLSITKDPWLRSGLGKRVDWICIKIPLEDVHLCQAAAMSLSWIQEAYRRKQGLRLFARRRNLLQIRGQDWSLAFPSLPTSRIVAEATRDFLVRSPSDQIVDAGSYSGLTALTCARVLGREGLVHAIEPDPRNHQCLVWNAHQHGQGRIRPWAFGIWTSPGRHSFVATGDPFACLLELGGAWHHVQTRPMVVLEDLPARLGLSRIDGLSLSLEGAEAAVLASARAPLASWISRLVIQPSMAAEPLQAPERLLMLLESCGYRVQVIAIPGHATPLLLAES